MIANPLSEGERISLVTYIFSDYTATEVVKRLSGDDAQAFVDEIDKVRLDTPPKNGIERIG